MSRFLLLLALIVVLAMLAHRTVKRALASPLGRELAVLWRALSGARQVQPGHDPRHRPSAQPGPPPARRDLVRCSRCGAFFPEARAQRRGGGVVCPGCTSGDGS